jgi:peptide/nickel transport system substrate-binding protein
MKRSRSTALTVLSVVALFLAGCGGGSSSTAGGKTVVQGGTFTMALPTDPGNLDPGSSASTQLFNISQFAYDRLLSIDASGAIQPQLAGSWKAAGKTVTLTLKPGITCSDGTPLTASDVVANLDYVADPANKSPFLGVFYPVGAKAGADDATRAVTITLASDTPFVLNGLTNLPIICKAGLADHKLLATTSLGTGPYQLTKAVPGSQYTYRIRPGYTWGPNGAGTSNPGMPSTVVVKIMQNQTTAANLLLSGSLNAVQITGPDAQRLDKAGLFSASAHGLAGEQWLNHDPARKTSSQAVRTALTQALNLPQLARVLTSGSGKPASTLAASDPVACPGDSVTGRLPGYDPAAAKAALAAAGVTKLSFVYENSGGAGVTAAAELAVQEWKAAGIEVAAKGQGGTAIQQTIFGSTDWDIAWLTLNVSSPDQLVPFFSGPGAADGGENFSAIKNTGYDAGVQAAAKQSGSSGCAAWLKAESQLIAAADVVPFANSVAKTYGKGAEFSTPGQIIPTSIRMLAS